MAAEKVACLNAWQDCTDGYVADYLENVTFISFVFENLIKTEINLIPESGPITGSYSCTWWNQCGAAADMGLTGSGLSEWRDALCQEAVFDTEKYYHPIRKELRGSLVFLLEIFSNLV